MKTCEFYEGLTDEFGETVARRAKNAAVFTPDDATRSEQKELVNCFENALKSDGALPI